MSTGSRILLAGGYRNEVWKVRAGCGHVIEKRYAEDPGDPNPMYPNLPDHEAAALAHLGPTGCAPELVEHRPAERVLVYRYVAGDQWRRGVGDVARLLHTVHHVEPPPLRRLHQSAAAALQHAGTMVDDGPSARDRARMHAHRPADVDDRPVRRPALVHTDCGPGNLVRGRHGLVLIDWQCPGIGDPVEDIACFLSPAMMILYAMRPHSATASAAFLTAYGDEEVVRRYRRNGAAWHYRIAAYCVWRAHRLRRRLPDVAERYTVALAAELALLDDWRRR